MPVLADCCTTTANGTRTRGNQKLETAMMCHSQFGSRDMYTSHDGSEAGQTVYEVWLQRASDTWRWRLQSKVGHHKNI